MKETLDMEYYSNHFSGTVKTKDTILAEYCSLEILGTPAVYTKSRIMEDTVPKMFHQYGLSECFDSETFILKCPSPQRLGL